jgi:hypothetical protein
MSYPLVVTVFILVVGAGLGWRGHQRLASVRQMHQQTVAEAAEAGIALNPSRPGESLRLTKRERGDSGVGVQLAAAEFIAFAQDMDAYRSGGGSQHDPAMQKRLMEFMDRMMALSATQFKALIAEVGANKDLPDAIRQDLIGFSITALANDQPQAAIALFSEASGLFSDARIGGRVLAAVLACWAKDDPLAALAWVQHHAGKHAALVTEDTKLGMIAAAAVQYPKFAFKLIGELALNDAAQAVQGVVDGARTAAERSATLAGLRGYLATLTDAAAREATATRALQGLALGSMRGGFESARQWLESVKLTPPELEAFAGGVTPQPKSDDNGQWVEWIGNTLAADQAAEKIHGFVSVWTQIDCPAAGKWLSAAADGPVKTAAIRAYAETVASYEPEVAAQWALTLPPGDERDATLRQIYQNWPRPDAAASEAAAAFAKEHGIE